MYEKVCNTKKQFFSKSECECARKKVSKTVGQTGLVSYKCEFCGWWHFGHKIGFERDEEPKIENEG